MKVTELREIEKDILEGKGSEYTSEQIQEGYAWAESTKTTFADMSKVFKGELESRLNVGEQLSLDFGINTYTSSKVESKDISFDCSEEDLYAICMKNGASIYLSNGINSSAIKKDFKKGVLPDFISEHVVVNVQEKFKISKTQKKGGDK